MLDSDKFAWGINIDNVWKYAGLPQPNTSLLPYLINIPQGARGVFDRPSTSVVKEICNDLAIKLKQARIDFVRVWFPGNFFKRKVNDGSEFVMDEFVDSLKRNGLEIIAVLGNGYSRFLPRGASVNRLHQYLGQLVPSSLEIVRHYYTSIKIWQIENEPNWWRKHMLVNWRNGLIWLQSDSDEIILKSLHDVMRQECPNGKIIINIEGDGRKVDYGRYVKYCDVIGLDFYPGYVHSHNTSADKIRLASGVKRQTGKQVIIAETGQPSGPQFFGYTENRQAEYIRSACQTAYSCDAVSALCVWRFTDSYWRSFPMQENYFGLLTKEGEPKKRRGSNTQIRYAARIKVHRETALPVFPLSTFDTSQSYRKDLHNE